MTKEELDAIASRAPYCRSFGESVSLSRAERDQLVALATDGLRYRWLAPRLCAADFDFNESGMTVLAFEFPKDVDVGGDCTQNVDAAMAKEEA